MAGLTLLLNVCAGLAPEAADLPLISRLTLTADGILQPEEFLGRIPLKPGDPADPVRIQQAIARLYATGDFHYLECTSSPFASGVWIDFRGVLKRYFSTFQVSGLHRIRNLESALARYFPLAEPYSETREQRFIGEVERFFLNRGFLTVEVAAQRDFQKAGPGVHLNLIVQAQRPYVIRNCLFQGDLIFPETHLRKAVQIKAKTPYTRDSVRLAIDNLKAFYVRNQYLEPKILLADMRQLPESDEVDLVFEIRAGRPVEVVVQGAKISSRKLKELLPLYREASLDNDLLEEGREALQKHLLGQSYSSADIRFTVQRDGEGGKTLLTYQVRLGQKLKVESIRTEGLAAIRRGEFLSLLAEGDKTIRIGSYFTLTGFERSQERVIEEYRKRGYIDAEFERREMTISESGTVDLELQIREGPLCTVRALEIKGNTTIPTNELQRRLLLQVERPFSEQQLKKDREALQEFLLSQGHAQASTTSSWHRDGASIDVGQTIEEGPRQEIRHIALVGKQRTRPRYISNNLGFRVGDAFSIKGLFQGEQRLYNTAAFDQVRIRSTDPNLPESHQSVVVGVRETPKRLLNFGIGYQEFEGPRGLIDLSFLNLAGTLRTAQIRLRGSLVNQSIHLNIRQPRPLNRNLESFGSLMASRKEEVSFTEQRLGASIQALRELSRINALIFRFNYENVRVLDSKVSIEEIPRGSQPLNLSSVSAAFVNDTRNNLFDPTRGAFNSVNLQVAAPLLASQAAFVKLFAQTQYYRRLTRRILIAEAFRLGLAHGYAGTDSLPITERFFAGGATTLRGFANDEAGPRDPVTDEPIGGNALLLNNLELRTSITPRFGGVVFYDTGNVFPFIGSIRLSEFTHSAGLGLRIETPIGVVRLDYGFNLRAVPGRARQHFFIGFGPLF